ncbi:hypothetical protein Brutus_00085 [Acinetobacter phage Brutus]|nr:hypothetical protein Brutus_00085 [Acinetobacter phage Brutus]
MNIEEIRKNAPDGAEFYINFTEVEYFKASNGQWSVWMNDRWCYVNSLIMQKYRDELRRLD